MREQRAMTGKAGVAIGSHRGAMGRWLAKRMPWPCGHSLVETGEGGALE